MTVDPEESQSMFTAKNAEGTIIFIGDAQSGKNGYYCLSCGHELVAKIGRLNIAHFAHAVRNASQKAQCAFADESYRHELAKTILQQIKQVKVPDVLVYPPDRNIKEAKRLRASETIKAHYVEVELTLRLTPDGVLRIGRFEQMELEASGDFYIRPDVTFLDANHKPILLIELVATNRPDAEKLARLNIIGINTIQIDLPRHSAGAIEHCFHTIESTKWLYNYEQARANYADLSQGTGGRVPTIDGVQEQFSREDIRCRTSRLRNLIRGVERYLESEPNHQLTAAISAAIAEVDQEQADLDEQLRQRTEGIKQSVRERFKDQVAACSQAEAELDAAEGELEGEEADVEGRYNQETARIEGDQDAIRKRPDSRVDAIAKEISAVERAIAECQQRKRDHEATSRDAYQRAVEAHQRTIDDCNAQLDAARSGYEEATAAKRRTERAIAETAANEQRLRKRIADVRKQLVGSTEPRIEAVRAEIDHLESTATGDTSRPGDEATKQLEQLEHAAQQAVRDGNVDHLPAELLPFKGLLAGWQAVCDCQNQDGLNRRLREIIREIESAAWKSWYRTG